MMAFGNGTSLCRSLANLRSEHNSETGEGRIMVFYHVHAENNWKDILMDQCTKLAYSGLHEAATAVNVGVSGPKQEVRPCQSPRTMRHD